MRLSDGPGIRDPKKGFKESQGIGEVGERLCGRNVRFSITWSIEGLEGPD